MARKKSCRMLFISRVTYIRDAAYNSVFTKERGGLFVIT